MADTALKNKEDVLLDIGEKLKEEKWTRAAIESYSVKNFVELDNVIRIAIDEGYKEELKTLCKENLKHYPNSIVGLYIVGILSLEESSVDDTHIPNIIKLFMENKKYKISEFLCEKILSFRESKFALKTLETVYEGQENQDELFNIKKRLVLIDSKDAGNAKFLGEHYEREGDRDQAMFYYRLATERYIKARSTKMVEEMWNKVVKLYPDDYLVAIMMAKKVREVLGDEKVADMAYNDYVRHAMKNERYKDALKVLKVIIDYKQGEKQLRKAIEDCYKAVYKDHSQLDKYLKLSAIGQSWKPHKEAIRLFETHIAFDKGSWVQHKNWGIGTVNDIQNDKVIIDFEGKKNHEMSLEIALRALSVLDNDHIIIWKKVKMEELKTLSKENPIKVLEIILASQGGEAATSEVRNCLVPDVMSEGGWNKWWILAKKQMEGSNTIIQSLTKRNILELREKEISVADEIVSKFKKTTNFENKVKLLIDFIIRGGDANQESARALTDFFRETMNASSESSEKRLVSFIALKFSNLADFNDNMLDNSVIFAAKNILELYNALDIELKKPFLTLLMRKIKDWDVKFSEFMLNSPVTKLNNFMLKELENYEKIDIINTLFASILNSYQENPDLFVWGARVLFDENEKPLKDRLGMKDSEIILRLLSLIDIMNNEIESKTNVGRNKKIVAALYDILLKKKALSTFIETSDESNLRSILTLLSSGSSLKEEFRKEFVDSIIARHPGLKKADKQEKVKIRHPFFVTRASYNAKKADLAHIMSVEIPENSRSIGEAMEKGDLRENAEYKAALERQDQLKAGASKLETELNQAKILDRNMVDTATVDVGTRVVLKTKDGGKEEYQILGQWDVDFNKRIISYHSPLGKALLDKKVGDKFDFDFGGENKQYEIISIERADFE